MTIERISDGMVPFNLIRRSLSVMGGLCIPCFSLAYRQSLASHWLKKSLHSSYWLSREYWPLIGRDMSCDLNTGL